MNMRIFVAATNFSPTIETNVDIARLLGFDSEVTRGGEEGDFGRAVINTGSEVVPCPDYSNDAEASIEALEYQNVVPYIKPVREFYKGGKRVKLKGFRCIFDHAGELHITQTYRKGAHAAAAALYFVLLNRDKPSGILAEDE